MGSAFTKSTSSSSVLPPDLKHPENQTKSSSPSEDNSVPSLSGGPKTKGFVGVSPDRESRDEKSLSPSVPVPQFSADPKLESPGGTGTGIALFEMTEENRKKLEQDERDAERKKADEVRKRREEEKALQELIRKETEEVDNLLNQYKKTMKDVSFIEPDALWEVMGNRDIPWKEFRSRCEPYSKADFVYVHSKTGKRMLNVSRNVIRGVKRWMTEGGVVVGSKFKKVLGHFTPLAIRTGRYAGGSLNTGFSLDIAFKSISLPSFAGPLSDTETERILKNAQVGDHRFRFSGSIHLGFAYDYVDNARAVRAIRFHRENPKGMDSEVYYRDSNNLIKANSLVELEDALKKASPELLKKMDVQYIPAHPPEGEKLDEDEKKLYDFMQTKKMEPLYDKLIQTQAMSIESIEDLDNIFAVTEERSTLRRSKILEEQEYENLKHSFERIKWTDTSTTVAKGQTTITAEMENKEFISNLRVDELKAGIGPMIAKGAYGEVLQCSYKNAVYALKRMRVIHDAEKRKKVFRSFQSELQTLKTLHHPNIVPFIGAAQDNECIYILMKFYSGSLKNHMKKQVNKFRFTENDVIFIGKEVSCGLAYLHKRDIAHCDMKTDNILIWIDEQERIRSLHITDFGVSLQQHRTALGVNEIIGTPQYHAPEIRNKVMGKNPDPIDYKKADIYAFGIILWELMTFHTLDTIPYPLPELDENFKNRYSKTEDQFKICLNQDPKQRPNSEELYQHLHKLYVELLKEQEEEKQAY